MIIVPGYRLLDLQIENKSWSLYKAYDMKDQTVVSIKQRSMQRNRVIDTAELIHEFHVTKTLDSDAILRPIKLEKYGEDMYMITAFFSGNTLKNRIIRGGPLDLVSFLHAAIRISGIVVMLHEAHIIHKSLQSQHILYNDQTNEIKITGFGQSTKLSNERPHSDVSPYQLKEHVAYMSPEQTGRMNKSLDSRTDLYALGIIFYELITGILPFQSEDPAELIHAHLAKVPIEPMMLHDEIPEPVSSIIMKLLEKMPELRYQSAYRLQQDLKHCLNLLQQTGEVRTLPLQEKHPTIFIEKSDNLYGRTKAMKQLLNAFHQIGENKSRFILIPGPSGIGKTVLVNELNQPLVRAKGYFISGKFIHLKKQIPYAPIIHAFQSLLRQILSEGTERVEKWRIELQEGLGTYAGVIANFIPELCWFVPQQNDISELDPQSVHHRFRHAIRRFVGVFASKEHPLILFVDDLQWADHATIDLIHHLLSNHENKYLLIIGAYRDNEVYVGHPFEAMLNDMKEEGIPVTNIPLASLERTDVNIWINEMITMTVHDADFLTDIVYRITQGNPFFIVQLFQSFRDENIVYFHSKTETWQLDRKALIAIPVSNTIIDVIVKRMEKLSEEAIQLLQLASCFGNQFNLKMLAVIIDKTYVEIDRLLWQGLEAGLIIPLDESYKWVYPKENNVFLDEHPPTYRFLHDKVQQAFYTSLSGEKREAYHLKIGMELVGFYDEMQQGEHIFDIVLHLNQCQERLTTQQKLALVKWNAVAGEKSKQRAASAAALNYFSIGKALLPQNNWLGYYDLTFQIMIGLGEAQYVNLLFDQAEETFEEIIHFAETDEEKLRVYHLKIMLYTHIHEVTKATNAGLEGLRLLGVKINEKPKKWEVAKEYLLTKRALREKKDKDLLALSAVESDGPGLIMKTMINTNSPAYHVDQNLATILMLKAFRMTMANGDMDLTALVYNNYALALSAGFNDYEGSYAFGKLAIAHAEKYNDDSLRARVYFVFGSFVNHWKDHIRYNLDYLERSQVLCIESGNLHMAGANASFIGLTMFIKGDYLNDVAEGIERQLQFAKANSVTLPSDFLEEMLYWIHVLSIPGKGMDWELPAFTDDPSAIIIHYTIRLQMTYLFQKEEQAMDIMAKLESIVDNTLVLVIAPDYYFYHALWSAKLMCSGKLGKKRGKSHLKQALIKLKNWAEHAPDNYMHKYLLIKGELYRTKGDGEEAVRLYNRAISLAEEHGFLQDAALGNNCAASYYLDRNLAKSANIYLKDMYQFYIKWGAARVADDLYQQFPAIFTEDEKETDANALKTESLDMNTIFEAAAVISDEVNLNQLLWKLMHLVVINSGAEQAFLLLNQNQELQLAATNHLNEEIIIYDHPEPIHEKMGFSLPIVQYTISTNEAIVLDNATEKGKFVKDRFVEKEKAKSILCLPVLYQGQLTGVLYLGNDRSPAVFTEERLLLLTWLASQAAISIENSYLYANLETTVEERTALLNETNQSLVEANQSLADSKETRRQLLVNISHDIHSPIATIQGYVDAILDGLVESPAQQKDYLLVIKRRLISLSGLVDDLFELAQLESGRASMDKEIVRLDQFFSHLCSLYVLEMEQDGLDYDWKLPSLTQTEYPLVEVDVQRIEQVMNNLVGNAMNHTNKSKISIQLSLENPGEAVISVVDQGEGISEADLSHVFDRFYTKNNKRKKKGHGLGLSISKEIILAHGGNIWVESEKGIGTKFSFTLTVF